MTVYNSLFHQVKKQLLPLPIWEAILERLIELLPRTFIPLNCEGNNDIIPLKHQSGFFQVIGKSPKFTLHHWRLHQRGWFYIEGALVRNNGDRRAYFQLELKDQTLLTIPVPTNLRGTIREVIFIPADIQSIYWLPTTSPGYFSQSPLLVHKISSLESSLRRLYRVLCDLKQLRNQKPESSSFSKLCQRLLCLHESYLLSAHLRLNRLCPTDYATYIERDELNFIKKLPQIQRQIQTWIRPPCISLIIHLKNPQLKQFSKTLEDLSGQLYANYEIVVAASLSDLDKISKILDNYMAQGVKILRIQISERTNKAKALNKAINTANGHYFAKICSLDRFPRQAMYYLAQEILSKPSLKLVYTDDDELDSKDQRIRPRFKPDWNPDLLFSTFYMDGLCLYRKEDALAIGGFRSIFPQAEEYDLCLRFTRLLSSKDIVHIPKIACHLAKSNNPHTVAEKHRAEKNALMAYFSEKNIAVEEGTITGSFRTRYPLPSPPPMASIIIPSRDKRDVLQTCIESIVQKSTYPNWEIVIIDNQTTHPEALSYLQTLKLDSRFKIIPYDAPFNFAAMNNLAVKQAKGEVLVLLNNDTEIITVDWLEELISQAIRPEIGAVGAKLLYSNNTIQHAGVILGLGGVASHGFKYLQEEAPGYCNRALLTQNYSAVTGACLAVRKELFEQVGGLDEKFAVAFNDVDFCLRLMDQGLRNIFTPWVKLYHHESLSRGHDDTPEKQAILIKELNRFTSLWGALLHQDPAYNPNLSLEHEGFTIKSF